MFFSRIWTVFSATFETKLRLVGTLVYLQVKMADLVVKMLCAETPSGPEQRTTRRRGTGM